MFLPCLVVACLSICECIYVWLQLCRLRFPSTQHHTKWKQLRQCIYTIYLFIKTLRGLISYQDCPVVTDLILHCTTSRHLPLTPLTFPNMMLSTRQRPISWYKKRPVYLRCMSREQNRTKNVCRILLLMYVLQKIKDFDQLGIKTRIKGVLVFTPFLIWLYIKFFNDKNHVTPLKIHWLGWWQASIFFRQLKCWFFFHLQNLQNYLQSSDSLNLTCITTGGR